MSYEHDMTLPKHAGDVNMLQGTASFQNYETLNDMQCFGYVWQNIPAYHVSWECSTVSANLPVNYETLPFPVLPSKVCDDGCQEDHFPGEETSSSPWSLLQDSGPSSASTFTEASPYSESFGQGMQTGSNDFQSLDLVGPGIGAGSWQQTNDTAQIPAQPQQPQQRLPGCVLGNERGPQVADASQDRPSEVIRSQADPSKGEREENSNSRPSGLSLINTDHQGKKAKVVDDKKGNKSLVRARNRVSAAKCRNQKRHHADKLKVKVEELADLHQELSLCFNEVKSEVMRLKLEILRHADCDCDVIRGYISAEANKIVDKLTRDDPLQDGCDMRSTPTTFNSNNGSWY